MQFTNGHPNNGGSIMRYTLIALCLAFLATLSGCGKDNTIDVKGTLPVDVNGANNVATWDPDQCFSDEDCSYDKLCVIAERASEDLEFDVYRCEAGCDVEFFTVMNEDGTGATTKDGDSCQRDGDTTVFCHPQQFVCTPYTVEPEPVDPVEPPPAKPLFKKVHCCFDAAVLEEGMYAQLAWSTANTANPSNFGKDGDLELDQYGCFTSTKKVENATYYQGFWTELTRGKVQDWTDKDQDGIVDEGEIIEGQWIGALENGAYLPLTCEVDDVSVTVANDHLSGCGTGFFDSVLDDGTTANCLE